MRYPPRRITPGVTYNDSKIASIHKKNGLSYFIRYK